MPAKQGKERSLLTRFLLAYEKGTWADAKLDWVDERLDGAVELVATRQSDGSTLAIEQTVIQPHPREKEDFARFDRAFTAHLGDPSLRLTDSFLYVDIPMDTLQRGEDWPAVAREVCDCIRGKKESIPEGWSELRCVTTTGRELVLQTRRIKDPGAKEYLTIIRRYGDFDLPTTVRTALETKLPKLAGTSAQRRLLMLERDQWHVDHSAIAEQLVAQRLDLPLLASVDEIWIAETHDNRHTVLFDPVLPGKGYAPVYTFNGDELHRSPGY
jgi:hypothetical protein